MTATFLAAAEEELREAARFYENEASGLGLTFLAEAHRAVNKIEALPEAWTIVRQSIRKKTIGRFPYSLLYSIESTKILIVAVAHQKRRPNYWLARLKK